MQRVTLIGALLLFFTIAAPAQTTSNLPLITVSGEAAVQVAPDEVVFKLESWMRVEWKQSGFIELMMNTAASPAFPRIRSG